MLKNIQLRKQKVNLQNTINTDMKELICNAVKVATTLDEVRDCVFGVFTEVAPSKGAKRLGYVAGIITSDGREHVDRNIIRLAEHTERLRQTYEFPIFSATDVFPQEVFDRIDAFNLPVDS